ncbi:hypothetical protein E4H12_15325 [Candidatus Thorarchaeota archaeon]|nr:MAG: hypothetical protein E4H12_15325 [Candidatus Thorarchaeota archaeon]
MEILGSFYPIYLSDNKILVAIKMVRDLHLSAVYEFPKELDQETARAKLETMGISIDKWTEEQERYAKAYAEGT